MPKTAVLNNVQLKAGLDAEEAEQQVLGQDPEHRDSEPAVLPAEADRTESGPAACTSHLVRST